VSPIFTVNFERLPGGVLTASVANGVREGIHAPAAPGASDRSLVDATVNSKPLGIGHATRERTRV
jgi:hypothetical protein